MLRLRIYVACILALLLTLAACNRGGHSRKFRNSAEEALQSLRAANNSESSAALLQAEAAISEAKAKIETNQDLNTADVLNWYATLLHRRDRRRTENWRAICDAEAQMLLDAEPTTRARVWGKLGLTEVAVKRGDCQAAFFQMLAEDCAAHDDPASCNPPTAGR